MSDLFLDTQFVLAFGLAGLAFAALLGKVIPYILT